MPKMKRIKSQPNIDQIEKWRGMMPKKVQFRFFGAKKQHIFNVGWGFMAILRIYNLFSVSFVHFKIKFCLTLNTSIYRNIKHSGFKK